jgi:hypothetical protein
MAYIKFSTLKNGDAFQFEADGTVFVKCTGGFRPGRGGSLYICDKNAPVLRYITDTTIKFDAAILMAENARLTTSIITKKLDAFPKGEMGLTPDHIKSSPEFQLVMKEFEIAFAEERKINSYLTKHFKKELYAYHQANRQKNMK